MTRRRLVTLVVAAVLAVPAALVLYLAFGDLSRHKGRIESLVTQAAGRPFAIDGTFELEVLPEIAVLAERVRLGNAAWGSQAQMVEVGRLALRVGLWSLLSGPVDVRSFELSDVSLLLEKDAAGRGNWILAEEKESAQPAEALGPGAARVPAVVLHAKLDNLRFAYREPEKPDRTALLETFTIDSGAQGLLAISGKGKLEEHPANLSGDVGPLNALIAGRDIRMALEGAVGNLRLHVKGSLGRLDPLDDADLALRVENPDVGAMLKNLRLPPIATGAMSIDARLADAGELTRLDLDANLGDMKAKVGGTLRTLGLPGSDLRFEASVADAARLASALGASGLPAGVLTANGRIESSREEIKLEGVSASYAGARAKADGTLHVTRGPAAGAIRFNLAAESLAKLRDGLPAIPISMSGNYAGSQTRLELQDLKGRIGESEFAGGASAALAGKRRVDAELRSPRLDVTPFFAQGKGDEAKAHAGAGAKRGPPRKHKELVFTEEPLPLDQLKSLDARLHLAVGELRIDAGALKDVDGVLNIGGGQLALEVRARGAVEGTLTGSIKLAPEGASAAGLNVNVAAKDLRAGFGTGGPIEPKQEPVVRLDMDIQAKGASARQLAASANGLVLLTLGPGKVKAGLLGLVGGDLLGELGAKLNPFAAQDPYTQLDCVVTRADIVDGHATVKPVLMQSEKVTVVAVGKVDLHTEELTVNFNTRPRTGIGISAGMFTAPFIELAGTLASPRIGVGAKGATAGAAAAATGGVTVLAQGLLDRVLGAKDLCKETLDEAAQAAK